jgi:hypothetical protein
MDPNAWVPRVLEKLAALDVLPAGHPDHSCEAEYQRNVRHGLGLHLNPKLATTELEAFEGEHRIRLPFR